MDIADHMQLLAITSITSLYAFLPVLLSPFSTSGTHAVCIWIRILLISSYFWSLFWPILRMPRSPLYTIWCAYWPVFGTYEVLLDTIPTRCAHTWATLFTVLCALWPHYVSKIITCEHYSDRVCIYMGHYFDLFSTGALLHTYGALLHT